MKTRYKIIKCMIIFIFSLSPLYSNNAGDWGISAAANYSQPVGGLNEWFKSTVNFAVGAGKQINDKWFVESGLEYTKYDDENLSGYAKGRLQLELQHIGITVNGNYKLGRISILNPYLNLGGGLYSWKGIRGEIQADSTLNPVLPFIAEKKLEEWNWGFRAGLGVEFNITEQISIDILGYYRIVVGDLWPTLQPHIELENVSGFTSVNVSLQVRYYIK